MEAALALVSILGLILVIFILTHIRPLTEDEVKVLGTKRRGKQIHRYFSFDRSQFGANKEFKRRMKPSGKFYRVRERLHEFPAIAAALLKYKKHEWIIVAFERNKEIFFAWLNKGLDRSSVSLHLKADDIVKTASANNATSVLTFHNHPNPDPNYLDCTKPSKQDIATGEYRSSLLNGCGVNLASFVCERGRHYQYLLSPADSFLPLKHIIKEISEVNGKSRSKNLALHIERIF